MSEPNTNQQQMPDTNPALVHQPAVDDTGVAPIVIPGPQAVIDPATTALPEQLDPMAGAAEADPVVDQPAEQAEDAPEHPQRPTRAPNPNVEQGFPVYQPLTDPWDDDVITLVVPDEQAGKLETALASYSKGDQENLAKDERWIAAAGMGIAMQPRLDMNDKLDERAGAKWRQVVTHNNKALGITKPKLGDDDNAILSGERALQRTRAYMGLGGQYRIPLWNSGFWLTVKTPGDDAILELDRKLAEEKIALGRATAGLLFSNASVFIVDHVIQFVLDHMVSATLKDSSRENVTRHISIHDIQHLAWGMACSIWPNGFQYARAVLGDTPEKNRVVEGKINVSKLQWIDIASLTDWQIKHMANITIGSMTNDDLERYQKEFTIRGERRISLNENVHVNLGVPSVDEHLISGQKWVNNIVTMTNRVFGMDQDDAARNAYVTNQGKATLLRQYGHWVKSVELGTGLVTDQATIESQLDLFSSDDTARDLIMNEVIKYAEDTTVAFIAVPTVDEREEQKFPRMPHLLPIDALTTFFTLLRQKLPQILTR
jgi:hypothetical protein